MQIPISGHPLHTRSLTVVVSAEAGGRWRARGDVVDLRKSGFVPMSQRLQPAGIIHLMTVRVDFEPASRRLESISVAQPFVAIEPSSATGGECCRDPAPRLQELVGECLDVGFPRRLGQVFGGALGCSHLLILLQLMGSALPRGLEREARLGAPTREPGERVFQCSSFVEGFEAGDGGLEYAVQLHDFHARAGQVSQPLERLARHDEVRLFARVEMPSLKLTRLDAAERTRDSATLASAAWSDPTERLTSLVGEPVVPGMARRVFAALGGDEGAGLLRDALLQLAPGHIQVMASIADRWFAMARSGAALRVGGGPAVATLGGFPDSCYMWRRDGILQSARQSVLEKKQKRAKRRTTDSP
ncbi:MAG: DUF2889 domain-containing protein [Myxococcota bacterium]